MTTKFKHLMTFIVFTMGFLLIDKVHSQNTNSSSALRAIRAVELSEFIFEGIIISQNYYLEDSENGKRAFTANTVLITHIFKGSEQIHCGEILLIHRGTSGQWVDFGYGLTTFDHGPHIASYGVGQKGIFFTIENELFPNPDVNPTDNSVIVRAYVEGIPNYLNYNYDPRYLDYIDLETANNFAEGFDGLYFDSYEELFDYISVTFQLDSNNFEKCEGFDLNSIEKYRPVLINPNQRNKKENNVEQDIQSPKQEESIEELKPLPTNEERKKKVQFYEEFLNQRIKNNLQINNLRANENLTYSIENETYTGTNPRYLEFDIMVSCNQSGTYLDNAPIHLSYNANAFGANIVSNNKLHLTKGSLFNHVTYEDPNSLANDWDSDTVALVLGLDFTQTSFLRTEVPTTPIVLLHVKIEIASCYEPAQINFVNKSNLLFVSWFTSTATAPLASSVTYNDITYTNNLDVLLCQPIITNYTNTLRAGVGDVLVIQGKHFGDTQGNGMVMFRNANGGQILKYKQFIPIFDKSDSVLWSDNEIRVVVPSYLSAGLGEAGCAGSGGFMVKTHLGDSIISDTNFTVKYAISTTPPIPGLNNEKFRLNLVNTNSDGSYTFRCDTSISNYPMRKAVVEKAIKDWNCKTGVNWILGNDTTISATSQDNVNLIYIDNSFKGVPLAFTSKYSVFFCSTSSGNMEAFNREVDIALSFEFSATDFPQSRWWSDTSGNNVPQFDYDLYGVLLHELGHAHSIAHVNDISDVMYHATLMGPYDAINRNYNAWKWSNLVDAGADVVEHSETRVYTGCSSGHLISRIPEDCSIIDEVAEYFQEKEFDIYPNPTSDKLYIKVSSSNVNEISIYNIQGAEVQSVKISSSFNQGEIYQIDMDYLTSGIYIVSLKTNETVISQKIIKH